MQARLALSRCRWSWCLLLLSCRCATGLRLAQVADQRGIAGLPAFDWLAGACAELDNGLLIRERDDPPRGAEQRPTLERVNGAGLGLAHRLTARCLRGCARRPEWSARLVAARMGARRRRQPAGRRCPVRVVACAPEARRGLVRCDGRCDRRALLVLSRYRSSWCL